MSVKPEKKVPEEKNVKLLRYRAGRAPEWADDDDEENYINNIIDVKVERKNDARIERLKKTNIHRDEAIRRRREIVAEVVAVGDKIKEEPLEEDEETNKQDNEDMEDEEGGEDEEGEEEEEVEMDIDSDDEARRERARLMYLRKKKEEDELLPIRDEEEEEEEVSEYETDSEYEEDFPSRPMFQPQFVRKENRETIVEKEKIEEEYERLEQLRVKQLEERVQETKKMVVEEKAREIEEAAKEEEDDEKVMSDEEEENEAKEYELWKVREIARIRRDKEERDRFEKEREDTEKRRNLSDMEIRQMDQEKFLREKKKWKFLQTYYHKGAFFSEGKEDDIQRRDYSAATGDDLIDKTLLPKVMQVKKFGRSGRTKYTHLADQDTTKWDAGWMGNDSLRVKYNQKMGGMHGNDRPSLKRKNP